MNRDNITGKNVLLEACIDKEIERKATPPWILY